MLVYPEETHTLILCHQVSRNFFLSDAASLEDFECAAAWTHSQLVKKVPWRN